MPLESSGAPLHQLPPGASGHDARFECFESCTVMVRRSLKFQMLSNHFLHLTRCLCFSSFNDFHRCDQQSSTSATDFHIPCSSLAGQHSSKPRISSRPNSDSVLSGGSGKSSRQPTRRRGRRRRGSLQVSSIVTSNSH